MVQCYWSQLTLLALAKSAARFAAACFFNSSERFFLSARLGASLSHAILASAAFFAAASFAAYIKWTRKKWMKNGKNKKQKQKNIYHLDQSKKWKSKLQDYVTKKQLTFAFAALRGASAIHFAFAAAAAFFWRSMAAFCSASIFTK